MDKNKKLKSIIVFVIAVAVVLAIFLVGGKSGVFKEEPTTELTEIPTAKITFIEGHTLVDYFKQLDENGVASFESLMSAAKSYNFLDYSIFSEIEADENRYYKLEGYLFPDTYDFYIGEAPESVIGRFLSNSDSKFTAEMKQRASELGYSVDEIITIASIIQAESATDDEAKRIAGILYNRIEADMLLQMDSTYDYVNNDIKPYDSDGEKYKEYYNTYNFKGLPVGPICNPGVNAINAALYPEETDYYYFCHDKEGNTYYAKNYNEHLRNCDKAGL